MKKHILRTLAVMLMACLGVGILAACGGSDGKKDPAETLEGYWTGATAEVAQEGSDPIKLSFAASVKLVGDSAYIVCEMSIPGEGGTSSTELLGYTLAKQADGSYSYTYDTQNDVGHMTGKLNTENKLEVVTDMFSQTQTMTLTFTTKVALSSGLGLTGTWYELYTSDGQNYDYPVGKNCYDFTNKKFKAFDNEKTMTVVEVGGYTMCIMDDDDFPSVIYKSGDVYYVDSTRTKLTQTAPSTPTPTPTPTPSTPTATPVTIEDTNAIGIWGGTAAQEILLRRGTTVKLEATYSALNADADHTTAFAGINVQIVNGIEFFFLRTDVEGALVTNGDFGTAKWRNASGRLVAHEIGATAEKFAITEYSDNNGAKITADAWLAAKLAGRTVIEIAFESDDKIVVTETYYTDKTGNTVYVSFAYTLSGLAASSYSVYFAAQQGTAVATSKITTTPVSANQTPSASDAITMNPTAFQVAGWTTEIRKGETLVLSGKVTLHNVANVWTGFVASVSDTLGAADVLRMDNYIIGKNTAAPTTDHGFSFAYDQTAAVTTLTAEQAYDATVTVDWQTDLTKIVISLTIGTVTTEWTVSADGNGSLAQKYYFNLGSDNATVNLTSAVRTAESATAAD